MVSFSRVRSGDGEVTSQCQRLGHTPGRQLRVFPGAVAFFSTTTTKMQILKRF